MKTRLLALLGFTLFSCATFYPVGVESGKLMGILPMKDGRVTYEIVRKVEAGNDAQIFRQARRWFALRVLDPKTALQAGDFLTKDVIGSGEINHKVIKLKSGIYVAPKVVYTVTIESYNGYYRCTLSNFRLLNTSTSNNRLTYDSGYPIESGTKTSKTANVKAHFQRIDESVNLLTASLDKFLIDNVGESRQP